MIRPDLRSARLQQVHQLMRDQNVSGLYLDGVAVNYLRGFRKMHLFVPADKEPIVMCGNHERENPLRDYLVDIEEKWIQEATLHTDEELLRLCQECGASQSRLGVFLSSMPQVQYKNLTELLPKMELVDVTKPYLDMMKINDVLNMEYADRSAQIVMDTFETFCRECQLGDSVTQLNRNMDANMIRTGVTGTFNMIRRVYRKPENVALSSDVIAAGDAYFCEISASYEDVWTQHIFPVLITEDNDLIQRMSAANFAAYQRVASLIHPGIRSDILHAPIAEVFAETGFCGPATFSCVPIGHYMGMQMDGGTFSPGNNVPIEEGMIIVIHTTARDETNNVQLFGPGGSLKVTQNGCIPFFPDYNHVRIIAK